MKRIIIAALFTIGLTHNVFGHSKMSMSNPQDGAILTSEPKLVDINFNAPVRVTKIGLTHKVGDQVQNMRIQVPTRDFVKKLSLTPQMFGNGLYEIEWRALAEDGHAMKGSFSFSVKAE